MEPVQIVFLGTAAAAPTPERNLSSLAIRYLGEWILFDCPEGCQRQMLCSGVSYMKISKIFLTHLHLDHVLGLPGLIATMQMHQRQEPLTIFCPKGWKPKTQLLVRLAPKTGFEIKIEEMTNGTLVENGEYAISAVLLKHEIDCYGLVFEQAQKPGKFLREKAISLKIPEGPLWRKLQSGKSIKLNGKTISPKRVMDSSKKKNGAKISYIVDTAPGRQYHKAIANSDVLIHEATFGSEHAKRAKETQHSTATDAAKTAAKTKAKQLILTHLSSRHKTGDDLAADAQAIFKNCTVAKDLESITIKV
ncbi:MAG: ribonuclease Z [Candidatus Micrarchaeota archaeon]